MSSNEIVSDAAEGVTKGALSWSYEKIKGFIQKLKDKKLAFVQDPNTIEMVKEQYLSGESKFYEKYIKNTEILLLVRMGLTLRKLENDKTRQRNLRDKILKKYSVKGLHIAEFVQNGVLNRYIGIYLDELDSIENLSKEIEEVLNNIEKHALFIQGTSSKLEIIKKANTIVDSHSPSFFIVSGFKSAAGLARQCENSLKQILKGYEFEKFSSGEKENLFFKKKLD